jgi:hypothetical protein
VITVRCGLGCKALTTLVNRLVGQPTLDIPRCGCALGGPARARSPVRSLGRPSHGLVLAADPSTHSLSLVACRKMNRSGAPRALAAPLVSTRTRTPCPRRSSVCAHSLALHVACNASTLLAQAYSLPLMPAVRLWQARNLGSAAVSYEMGLIGVGGVARRHPPALCVRCLLGSGLRYCSLCACCACGAPVRRPARCVCGGVPRLRPCSLFGLSHVVRMLVPDYVCTINIHMPIYTMI